MGERDRFFASLTMARTTDRAIASSRPILLHCLGYTKVRGLSVELGVSDNTCGMPVLQNDIAAGITFALLPQNEH